MFWIRGNKKTVITINKEGDLKMNRKTAVTNILSNVTGIDINGIEYPDSTDQSEKTKIWSQTRIYKTDSHFDFYDTLNQWKYRWGIGRMNAIVTPGLWALGTPDENSPVLVSANYRMSFDVLRKNLEGDNAWILVLDTKGINVWCAAGKGTFGTEEIVRRVQTSELEKKVKHHRLIVQQLGAPGVASHEVEKQTGFRVVYGPVRAKDLPAFLDTGRVTSSMRLVTFNLAERVILIPMELRFVFLPVLLATIILWFVTGPTIALSIAGIMITGIAIPVLHNILPGKWLTTKGAFWGFLQALVISLILPMSIWQFIPFLAANVSASAFIALNFTGATTYTSVNGVRQEIKTVIPWIAVGIVTALSIWIIQFVWKFI